jgi:hypothetical protein
MQIPTATGAINASRAVQAQSSPGHASGDRGPHKVGRAAAHVFLSYILYVCTCKVTSLRVVVSQRRVMPLVFGDEARGDWRLATRPGKAAASGGWVLGDEITRIPLPASRLCPPGRSKPVEPSRNPTFVDPTTRRRAHVPTGRPRQRSPPNTTCAQPLERIAFPLLAAGACHNLILKRVTCPLQSPFGPSLACWTDPALNIRTLSLPRLPLPALLTGIAPSALQTLARTSKFSSLIPTTTPQESLAIHFVPFVHSALPRATCCCESPDACATTRWHAALA